MKILREANCEILGDVKNGLTKDVLKAQVKELKKDLKTFKDAVVEALGGPKFNQPYEDCIRLRDITCEIAGRQSKIDELEVKVYDLKKEIEELATRSPHEIEKIKSISYNLAEDVRKLVEENEEQVASIHDLEKELKEIKEVKKIVTEVATQTETDGLQEEIDKLKKNNEDGCKLIKALMDKLHPITARVLGVAQYLVDNPYYEGEDNVIERSTICDLLGFTPEFLTEVEDNGGKVGGIRERLEKIARDEIKEEEEEIDIVRDFGDQSIQAKRAGIGVFKKE